MNEFWMQTQSEQIEVRQRRARLHIMMMMKPFISSFTNCFLRLVLLIYTIPSILILMQRIMIFSCYSNTSALQLHGGDSDMLIQTEDDINHYYGTNTITTITTTTQFSNPLAPISSLGVHGNSDVAINGLCNQMYINGA